MSMIAHISRKASASGVIGENRHTRNARFLRCAYHRYVPTRPLQDRRRLCENDLPRDVSVVAVSSFGPSSNRCFMPTLGRLKRRAEDRLVLSDTSVLPAFPALVVLTIVLQVRYTAD